MSSPTGAEAICSALRRQGVDVVFGIPGIHNLALFEALRQSGIRVVVTTHEQGAAFMANGYSRAGGKVGVFLTVPGPGLTNAFTGIAESLLDSCPVLAIVTDVSRADGKRYHLHEIPQLELVRPIAKGCFRAGEAADIPGRLAQAWQLAVSGEPGPAVLEVAPEALFGTVGVGASRQRPAPTPATEAGAELDAVVQRLAAAKRVGLVVGQGAAGVASEIAALAEWLAAPVATTPSGRGCLPETHPLSLSFIWRPGGLERANAILSECDLTLVIGAKLSENGSSGYRLALGGDVVQADASAAVLGANYPTTLALPLAAEVLLPGLLARKEEFGPRPKGPVAELIARERQAVELQAAAEPPEVSLLFGETPYSGDQFFAALRGVLAAEDVVVTDCGYHEILAGRCLQVLAPRTLLTPSDYQSTGYGVPAAIGAALAQPQRRVVAIVGDGGFAATGLELLTATRERLNLLTVVFNDGCFGLLKRLQEQSFGATCAVELLNPDFAALATSLHQRYRLADGEPAAALAECLEGGPTLLEVPVVHSQSGAFQRMVTRYRGAARQAVLRWQGL